MASAADETSISNAEHHILKYSVTKWSSYSSVYSPSNILSNSATNQASRWSSESNSPPQYLILELEKTSILTTVHFGKFEKTHVCNLKKFKIYAGPSEEKMVEVLDSGLNNDHVPETFDVKTKVDSCVIPVKFVKILPLQSWGASYNFSIWYVELSGIDREDIVNPIVKTYNQHREEQAVRLCLKHFRQHNYMEAFESLRKKTKVSLEDPLLEQLYKTLVTDGDYIGVEDIVRTASQEGLFNYFVNSQQLEARWTKIETVNRDGSDQRPGPRGGHQMVINAYTESLYLFGGWDGEADLADFWSYHVPSQHWNCISSNTEQDGGPSARSCHKMIIDCERQQLFVLGRYLDMVDRNCNSKGDFYVYDILHSKWILITDDTHSMGGPRLIFDHQMSLDSQDQVIYVFGGKTQCLSERYDYGAGACSGLFTYHIPTNHWREVRKDCVEIKARYGHSMMFNHKTRKLYVFAGQRGKEVFNDLFSYDVDNDSVHVLTMHDCSKNSSDEPPCGFTQRATMDVDDGLIHLLLSMNRQHKEKDVYKNVLWIYDLASGHWTCLPDNTVNPPESETETPRPRFAHQLVYDHLKKVHYIFGGNPGHQQRTMRLDDFWSLSLCRPSQEHILHQCRYLIRKYKFKELVQEDSVKALQYLQNDLHEIVNHENKKETASFQKLTTSLFDDTSTTNEDMDERGMHFAGRLQLYEMLINYFPPSMTQPKHNLLDLVK